MRLSCGIGAALLILFFCASPLLAQDELTEDSRVNTNLAMSVSAPLNPLATFIDFGWGVNAGAGYNITKNNAIIGEFMWNRFYPSNTVLDPLKVAIHSGDLHGHSDLFALTANYRYEFRGRSRGVYVIMGGGLYHRETSLSHHVVTGTTTTCTRVWLFWNFTCTNGVVDEDQTLASSGSGAFGVNGGVGYTVKVAEPRYRIYFEARYHYAPTTRFNTQFIPVAVGIRF